MSASYDVKKIIMESQYKSACCRRALLQGMLSSKAYLDDQRRICIGFESDEQVSFFSALVKEFYSKEPERIKSAAGGRGKRVAFESKSARNFILSLDTEGSLYSERCASCTASYLRGVFFATGRFTDPSKQFCLEFSLGNRISLFKNLFSELGFEMKSSMRRTEAILYTKNSCVIEDFFAAGDLNDTTYEIMNIKIRNDFLNNANRLRNFDTVNILKAVEAAAPQLSLIKELEKYKLLEMLPEELANTARLRLKYPDLSLTQLARLSVPPLSKSGITHRMQKIIKLGNELILKRKL